VPVSQISRLAYRGKSKMYPIKGSLSHATQNPNPVFKDFSDLELYFPSNLRERASFDNIHGRRVGPFPAFRFRGHDTSLL
jgi:hypothetical protein